MKRYAAALVFLPFCAVGLVAQVPATPCTQGAWETPFDHGGIAPAIPACANPIPHQFPVGNYNALHMSLIPKGPHRGKVLVWDHFHYSGSHIGQTRVLMYSIVDPVNRTFLNRIICMPSDKGDLFCAGHAWTAEGNLLVVGGSTNHGNPTWGGAKLAYVYDPIIDSWQILPDLNEERWYPNILMLGTNGAGQDQLLVVGGTHHGNGVNSYMAYEPPSRLFPYGTWQRDANNAPITFSGPSSWSLRAYPRIQLLSTGELFHSGMSSFSGWLDHYLNPGVWTNGSSQSTWRSYGSAVLYPITLAGLQDTILSMGGQANNTILSSAEYTVATQGTHNWMPFSSVNQPRWFHNTVLTADGTVIIMGGEQQSTSFGCSLLPALNPEMLIGLSWQQMAATHITRDYHSTAVLLPSGKILTAGGESRNFLPSTCPRGPNPPRQSGPTDYQVFCPPSVICGGRPTLTSPSPTGPALSVTHGSIQTIQHAPLPSGAQLAKVLLLRPGSVTHHADGNQRSVELAWAVQTGTSFQVFIPSSSTVVPKGYYMLFMMLDSGATSDAGWIKVQ